MASVNAILRMALQRRPAGLPLRSGYAFVEPEAGAVQSFILFDAESQLDCRATVDAGCARAVRRYLLPPVQTSWLDRVSTCPHLIREGRPCCRHGSTRRLLFTRPVTKRATVRSDRTFPARNQANSAGLDKKARKPVASEEMHPSRFRWQAVRLAV